MTAAGWTDKGLSPLARGNHALSPYSPVQEGTIPVRAGEPATCRRLRRLQGDYPRSRGGTARALLCGHGGRGLSPLARGNQLDSTHDGNSSGTIPARAGEPSCWCRWCSRCRDYPRSRGGTFCASFGVSPDQGLSPLARGNRFHRRRQPLGLGTIPARAGEPLVELGPSAFDRDYPRSRGGTVTVTVLPGPCGGLSPLARGNRLGVRGILAPVGTIPARAGEPQNPALEVVEVRDYPRSRGGT